eukprot:7156208-Prymnesium_polylepis.1
MKCVGPIGVSRVQSHSSTFDEIGPAPAPAALRRPNPSLPRFSRCRASPSSYVERIALALC